MGRRRGPETEDMPQGVILRKRNGKEYYYFQTKSTDGFRREYPIGRSKSEAADRLIMTRYGYKSKTALKIKRLRSAPQNKKQESALSEITD